MNIPRVALILLVLVPFSIFTTELVVTTGYLGFIELAEREPWGLQMLLDLGIALSLFVTWMLRDAKERGIPRWPYAIACVLLGSPAALVYMLHREWKGAPSGARAPAA